VVNFDAGTRLPLAKTSLGLACIVAAPIKERTRVLDNLRGKSDDWPALRTTIERAHREYEHSGFIVSQGSLGRDVSGVAVPMNPPGANATYAFNVAGASARMPLNLMRKELGPSLRRMVQEVTEALSKIRQPQLVLTPEND
jgi:DNA-binding IclR family transcriptional regulator